MDDAREEFITKHMSAMPVRQALVWCDAEVCGCIGCANRAGALEESGITKEEWRQWWRLMAESR